MKASSFKNWCTENISPQSWTRICLKCTDELRAKDIQLSDMEDKADEIEIGGEIFAHLNNALDAIYEMKVDESELANF